MRLKTFYESISKGPIGNRVNEISINRAKSEQVLYSEIMDILGDDQEFVLFLHLLDEFLNDHRGNVDRMIESLTSSNYNGEEWGLIKTYLERDGTLSISKLVNSIDYYNVDQYDDVTLYKPDLKTANTIKIANMGDTTVVVIFKF